MDDALGENELTYWRAYFSRRHFTHAALWLQSGLLRRLLLSVYRGKKDDPVPELEDLIPDMDL